MFVFVSYPRRQLHSQLGVGFFQRWYQPVRDPEEHNHVLSFVLFSMLLAHVRIDQNSLSWHSGRIQTTTLIWVYWRAPKHHSTCPHLVRLGSILQGSSSTYFFSSKIRLMMGFRTSWRYGIPTTWMGAERINRYWKKKMGVEKAHTWSETGRERIVKNAS